MQNLEQKFPCPDPAAAEAAARALGATDRGVIHQTDLFFPAPHARLKLRRIGGRETAELIAYRRTDHPDPTLSDYVLVPVSQPDSLIEALTHALGQPRELSKTRHLYLYKNTRIHIDNVDAVGTFVELETVLTPALTLEAADAERAAIVAALSLENPIAEAYIDLKSPMKQPPSHGV